MPRTKQSTRYVRADTPAPIDRPLYSVMLAGGGANVTYYFQVSGPEVALKLAMRQWESNYEGRAPSEVYIKYLGPVTLYD